MAKSKSDRMYSKKELEATRWGGYQKGMRRALEVAEGQLSMATSYYREKAEGGTVAPESREGGILEGIKAVVEAIRQSPELEGWRGR